MKEISLTQGKYALVDDDDYLNLNKFKWTYHIQGYAYRMSFNPNTNKFNQCLLMHRVIKNAGNNEFVDHRNRNKLDNRKENLRICNQSQNGGNSTVSKNNKSGLKGVYFDPKRQVWKAEIMVNRKKYFLGQFASAEQAAIAYDINALKAWGNFALLNYPNISDDKKQEVITLISHKRFKTKL